MNLLASASQLKSKSSPSLDATMNAVNEGSQLKAEFSDQLLSATLGQDSQPENFSQNLSTALHHQNQEQVLKDAQIQNQEDEQLKDISPEMTAVTMVVPPPLSTSPQNKLGIAEELSVQGQQGSPIQKGRNLVKNSSINEKEIQTPPVAESFPHENRSIRLPAELSNFSDSQVFKQVIEGQGSHSQLRLSEEQVGLDSLNHVQKLGESSEFDLNAILQDERLGVSQIKTETKQALRGPASTLSTDLFLNLREQNTKNKLFSKKADSLLATSSENGSALQAQMNAIPVLPQTTMVGTVSTGSNGQLRFDESVLKEMTNQINLISQAKTEGEIKIRLKPDHLGELILNVKSSGNDIRLSVQAQDDRAKGILEESIGQLRDGLSHHKLNLIQAEVVSAPAQSFDSQFAGSFLDSNMGSRSGSQFDQGQGQQTRQDDFGAENEQIATSLAARRNDVRQQATSNGRLDMIA